MPVFSFPKKELRLSRHVLKACLLRLVREPKEADGIAPSHRAVRKTLQGDPVLQRWTEAERSVLQLLGRSLDAPVATPESLSRKQWELRVGTVMDRVMRTWETIRVGTKS